MEQTLAKDPVCGKEVVAGTARGWDYNFENVVYYFCGSECRSRFNNDPKAVLTGRPTVVVEDSKSDDAKAGWSFQSLLAKLRDLI